MHIQTVIEAFAVGLIGGFTSGLVGISAGGGLVVFSTLLLGADQHLAQGISLIGQVPPTNLAGVKRYRLSGHRTEVHCLFWLAAGFLCAGPAGAYLTSGISDRSLRWGFVIYLVVFLFILYLKSSDRLASHPHAADVDRSPLWYELLLVGFIAGFSSGLLGIGGGLAITVCLTAWLKLSQHQAQLMSLLVTLIPTTIPAAFVYWKKGWAPPWSNMAFIILGLWFGSDIGARMANRTDARRLKWTLIGTILMMGLCMAWKAIESA